MIKETHPKTFSYSFKCDNLSLKFNNCQLQLYYFHTNVGLFVKVICKYLIPTLDSFGIIYGSKFHHRMLLAFIFLINGFSSQSFTWQGANMRNRLNKFIENLDLNFIFYCGCQKGLTHLILPHSNKWNKMDWALVK